MLLISTITHFLFPPLCVHCGREGAWLCATAQSLLDTEGVLLDPLTIQGVDRVIVRGSYDCAPLAQLIQKLKYHYWTGLAARLMEVLKPLDRQHRFPRETVIVPVPLHSRRHRERGFNQSIIISRIFSQLTRFPVVNLLQRHRYTTPQAQLKAAERMTNILGAFEQSRVASWPKSVILVDDVITTGSTIAECASVLRQHGVRHITAIALAKG